MTRHQTELSDDVARYVSDVRSLHGRTDSDHHATPAEMVYTLTDCTTTQC